MTELRQAGDGLRAGGAPVCDEHGLVHTDTITVYLAHFTGEPRARCEACGIVFAHWDCACEWEHECEGVDW